MSQEQITLRPIGRVESPLRDIAAAPKQGDEGAPDAWLALEPQFAAGLEGVKEGDEVLLFTWLDRADREVLAVHPRGDAERQQLGVFATRSPDRPNPIGLHRTKVIRFEANRLLVAGLEALDGTPILDLKPVLDSDPDAR